MFAVEVERVTAAPCGKAALDTSASRRATTTKFSKTRFMSIRKADAAVVPWLSSSVVARMMSFASFNGGFVVGVQARVGDLRQVPRVVLDGLYAFERLVETRSDSARLARADAQPARRASAVLISWFGGMSSVNSSKTSSTAGSGRSGV